MDAVNGSTSTPVSQVREPPRLVFADGATRGSADEAAFAEMIMPMVRMGCMKNPRNLLFSLQRQMDEVAEDLRGD